MTTAFWGVFSVLVFIAIVGTFIAVQANREVREQNNTEKRDKA